MTQEQISFKTQPIYKKPRILVVDEDTSFCEWLRDFEGCLLSEFVLCARSDDSLLKASCEEFDAVIVGVKKGAEKKAISLANKLQSLPNKRSIPIAFVLGEKASAAAIEKSDVQCSMTLSKPVTLDKIGSAISSLVSLERFNALIVSESPQSTAKLANTLNQGEIKTKFTLHPQRYMEFLYDFEPEVLLVDVDMFSFNPVELCERINSSSRWQKMAIVLFSSKGKETPADVLEKCEALAEIKLSAKGEDTISTIKTIARQMQEKRKDVQKDLLTGLPLRDKLYEKYVPQINDGRALTNLTLVWLDILKLNSINEKSGHTVGDRVLLTVSSFLTQRTFLVPSLVCRWNDDEFLIVLKASKDEAVSLIRNIVLDFTLITIPDCDLPTKLIAGISHFPDDGKSVDDLLDIAHWRLHSAKREPDGICFK